MLLHMISWSLELLEQVGYTPAVATGGQHGADAARDTGTLCVDVSVLSQVSSREGLASFNGAEVLRRTDRHTRHIVTARVRSRGPSHA